MKYLLLLLLSDVHRGSGRHGHWSRKWILAWSAARALRLLLLKCGHSHRTWDSWNSRNRLLRGGGGPGYFGLLARPLFFLITPIFIVAISITNVIILLGILFSPCTLPVRIELWPTDEAINQRLEAIIIAA